MSMKKSTDELLNNIKNTLSIQDYIKENKSEYLNISTDEYLMKLLREKGLKISLISISSCLGDYVYKVFNGNRKPNRDVYIAIGIAMKLNYNEMQLLLRLAKYLMLDPRDRRDSIFLYAISKNLTVMETNDILFDFDEEMLGKISKNK